MSAITLLEGTFKTSQYIGLQYLLLMDVDRLIAPCYESASLKPKKPRYGGWESRAIAGHSIGHWLSAAAAMVDTTGSQKLLQKLEYAVAELAYVQSHDQDGYVSGFPRDCFDRVFTGEFEVSGFGLGGSWVPWYSIHKIYAGLIDAFRLTGSELALETVIKLANWAKQGTDKLTEEQFQRMLICEHGGMTDAMAELFKITGSSAYLELAVRFCHKAILDPLSRGEDLLEGKHANTQIPKVIGAAKLYEITGESYYRHIAESFWTVVTKERSYIIGGNSIFEHFQSAGKEKLGVETAETCNTYNMLKLTNLLFGWSPKAEYMDFYERALYNHILASQDPETGNKMYFISTQPGHFKVYGTADESFWCCTGTGMENPARYQYDIYHESAEGIYVNLFISSRAVLKHAVIRQETDFPQTDRTLLTLEKAPEEEYPLLIRLPYWLKGHASATVNGDTVCSSNQAGYLEIRRPWSDGDTVEVILPMDLHLYRAKDDPGKVVVMYGPVVLAGALGRQCFPETDIVDNHLKLHQHPSIKIPVLVTDESDINQWITPVQGSPLTFLTAPVGQPGNQSITLIPFYELHHQRYTIYWKLMDQETYQNYTDYEVAEQERLNAITVDVVSPHEQQSEVEHGIRFHQSRSGYSVHAQGAYRDAYDNGYFSYRMASLPDKPLALQLTYFGRDTAAHINGVRMERDFDILVDGTLLARQHLEARSDQLYTNSYLIPAEATAGKREIEVKLAAAGGKLTGAVYKLRIVDLQMVRAYE